MFLEMLHEDSTRSLEGLFKHHLWTNKMQPEKKQQSEVDVFDSTLCLHRLSNSESWGGGYDRWYDYDRARGGLHRGQVTSVSKANT